MEKRSSKEPARPKRIGPYRIEEVIAIGGMGAVYRAFDERLARPVALKRVREDAAEGEFREQLSREARAIAQISHPNIVQVFDFLEDDNGEWIVMELVPGLTLRQILRSGVLDAKTTVAYAIDITRGLAAAHTRGIVHLDLKTENVIIGADGRAKILDFGLARWDLEREEDTDSSSGKVQGTPRSMSPEQARCEPADHRADLFSLGVLIYECLTDVSPFQVTTRGLYHVLSQICTYRQTPLVDMVPELPGALSDLVDKLLEKDRRQRPQSAEDVLLALQRILDTPEATPRVLFVDDEPDFEELIRQRFRREIRSGALEVKFAQNGREALDRLAEDQEIQVVFTDLNMPIMDGLTLIGELSKQNRTFVTVVISAYGDMGNIRAAMNLGAFDFLVKPLSFKDLNVTLEKAGQQAAWMRENLRLQAENQLLDEGNRSIRDAFYRYLKGDPGAREIFDPVLERVEGQVHRQMTLVTLEMGGFQRLPDELPGHHLFELLNRFFHDVVAAAQRHEGALLELKNGRVSVGFGVSIPRPVDGHRAMSCARDLRQAGLDAGDRSESKGGPRLAPRVAVDSGELLIERDSLHLSGPLRDRLKQAMDHCSDGQILTSEATLSRSGVRPKNAPVTDSSVGRLYEIADADSVELTATVDRHGAETTIKG